MKFQDVFAVLRSSAESHIFQYSCSAGCKVISKLELGTWAERLSEMVDEMKDSQSFETVKAKVGQITRWWDLTAEYLEKNSTKLGDAVQKVLKATATENPFPEGMDINWALDVQSAQTLDFFAGVQKGKVTFVSCLSVVCSVEITSIYLLLVRLWSAQVCCRHPGEFYSPSTVE